MALALERTLHRPISGLKADTLPSLDVYTERFFLTDNISSLDMKYHLIVLIAG